MFWLKKFITALLLPMPMGIFLITLGLILLGLHIAGKTGGLCLILGWAIILLPALSPITRLLINPLQNHYSPLLSPPDTVTKIVVLGGGATDSKGMPPNLTLGAASLSRLIEGIRLYQRLHQHNSEAQLILSGGYVFQPNSDASVMSNTAIVLGVSPKNIKLEAGSRNTYEEALYLKKTLKNQPFILVTSAYHMPRSMRLFTKLGMQPIPAPTQYFNFQETPFLWFIPSSDNLAVSDAAIHEYLGIAWNELRTYFNTLNPSKNER
ncbi:MAG: hypothetical protein A3E84_00375 [Gammaproteobacteria bacterium RIFCSPHIGHO2_12_FULL_42_13]|nr:MAG: hypothetical protein A3E84_00375 [Gammaproteobacteria bacterium RIFCSPHIGHO2_12_FULL_42_13]